MRQGSSSGGGSAFGRRPALSQTGLPPSSEELYSSQTSILCAAGPPGAAHVQQLLVPLAASPAHLGDCLAAGSCSRAVGVVVEQVGVRWAAQGGAHKRRAGRASPARPPNA